MSETPLYKKLGIKPGFKVLIMNAPEGYLDQLGQVPENVEVSTTGGSSYDFVQVFVTNKADVEQHAPTAMVATKMGGLLWFSYPKKTSKIKTDINRDAGWEPLWESGFEAVAAIAIDETWSALRFRPSAEVKSRKKE